MVQSVIAIEFHAKTLRSHGFHLHRTESPRPGSSVLAGEDKLLFELQAPLAHEKFRRIDAAVLARNLAELDVRISYQDSYGDGLPEVRTLPLRFTR